MCNNFTLIVEVKGFSGLPTDCLTNLSLIKSDESMHQKDFSLSKTALNFIIFYGTKNGQVSSSILKDLEIFFEDN